uniref:Uncharacterized protein n=1 Tax=Opuntia streptacantha TaxID=393608 RepID=A0A7C9AEY9_OPUST
MPLDWSRLNIFTPLNILIQPISQINLSKRVHCWRHILPTYLNWYILISIKVNPRIPTTIVRVTHHKTLLCPHIQPIKFLNHFIKWVWLITKIFKLPGPTSTRRVGTGPPAMGPAPTTAGGVEPTKRGLGFGWLVSWAS